MDTKLRAAPSRDYVDFDPSSELVQEEDSDTLILYVPGFQKEQLRVQLTPTKTLKLSGERPLENNKWSRFHKEFRISTNCDTNKITAKFENSVLSVKQPKLITPAVKEDKEKPISEAPKPQKRADEPQPQKNDQQHATQETTSMTDLAKQASTGKANELANAKNVPEKAQEQEKEKEPNNTNGKKSELPDAKNASEKTPGREKTDFGDVSQKTQGEEESELTAEEGNITRKTSEKLENLSDSVKDATKMDGGATKPENYKQDVGGEGAKLKTPRKLMNLVLLILSALVVGIYVTNLIRSSKKDEK